MRLCLIFLVFCVAGCQVQPEEQVLAPAQSKARALHGDRIIYVLEKPSWLQIVEDGTSRGAVATPSPSVLIGSSARGEVFLWGNEATNSALYSVSFGSPFRLTKIVSVERWAEAVCPFPRSAGFLVLTKDFKLVRLWPDGRTETLLTRDELAKVLSYRLPDGPLAYSGIAISPNERFVAMTVPAKKALYEFSGDPDAVTLVWDLQSQTGRLLGRGAPRAWMDDDTILIWSIIPFGDAETAFRASIRTISGKTVAERDNVGTCASDGKFIYLINISDSEGYSKLLDKPRVEVWTKDLGQLVESFHLPTRFSHFYNQNLSISRATDLHRVK